MRLFKFFLLVVGMVSSVSGYCGVCNYIGSPYVVNYGNIIVQRDVPVGQAISNEIYGALAQTYICTASGNEGFYMGMRSLILPYLYTAANGLRIYQTNVPGVGISFGWADQVTTPTNYYSSTNYIKTGNAQGYSYNSYPGSVINFKNQPFLQLWKTGNITSGSLSGQIAAFFAFTDMNQTSPVSDVPIYAGSGVITQVTCSIATPNLVFPIGDVLASSFGNAVGTIPTNASNTQNLGLNCDAGANINISLMGTQNPDVATTSVLALTNQGSADVAKGVGVQILYNGNPLLLNNRIVMKQSSGGQETFPITARYYQTKTAVTTGKANASATLDLTYQ
ncbi:fimbrial protein [Enterobacter cloacae]|uniref:fimbrial protein n=1 Tax=Enterobacter cloacae TaxID=550 RepID=UPI00259EE05F|nr:fimbrial protein [Enterobacter cloacae]EKV5783112.1 fimbrial protein [Enterobacter cloacae]HAS1959693.1 fimbrial protein [Enterobacter cloacae]